MQTNGDQSSTSPNAKRLGQRYTVAEAAKLLNTTVDGIRSRIRRGSLDSMKVDGTVYVLLDPDQVRLGQELGETRLDQSRTRPNQSGSSPDGSETDRDASEGGMQPGVALLKAKDETIAELRERIAQLTRIMETRDEELRRKDHLLAAALERIPELEAPTTSPAPEPRRSPESAAAQPGREEPQPPAAGAQEGGDRRPWWKRFFGFEQ
jgi:hypothetical protein